MAPKVAIITVLYNSESDLPGYFESVSRLEYPKDDLTVCIYDNASQDGSAVKAESLCQMLPFSCHFIKAVENSGFTGGNNRAFNRLRDFGFQYIFLLNPDTTIEPDCIDKLVQLCDKDATIGAAQPLILTLPDTEKINTTGNLCHYLGFGMVKDNGKDRSVMHNAPVRDIVSVSGAGFFLRCAVLPEGEDIFDEALFAYHEDFELSWRIRLRGYRLVLASQAIIYHRYTFGKGRFKFYLLERNRARVLLTHYSTPTLFILAPFIFMTEGLVFAQSIIGGWAPGKARAWWDTIRSLPQIAARRKYIQELRTVSDAQLMKEMHDILEFPEKTPFFVTWLYNPISIVYKRLVLLLIK